MGGIRKPCGCYEGPLSENDPRFAFIPCHEHAPVARVARAADTPRQAIPRGRKRKGKR